MCLRGQVYQKSLLTILDIHLVALLTPLLSSLHFTQRPVLPLFSPLPSSCAQTRCRQCAGAGWPSEKTEYSSIKVENDDIGKRGVRVLWKKKTIKLSQKVG